LYIGIFSDLPSLEILNLSCNRLIELDKDLFRDLSALKILNLKGNKIKFNNELFELDMDLFKNLAALKKLYLSSNESWEKEPWKKLRKGSPILKRLFMN
jgi:hypothetical protein